MTTMHNWGKNRGARGPSLAFLLMTLALLASFPAAGQIAIGHDMPSDERDPGSGYFPGDAGYWIGGAFGYIYDCWSEDNPGTGEWGLYCRTYQNGAWLGEPVQIVQSFGTTVFFPAGCPHSENGLYLIWSGSGQLFFSRSGDWASSWSPPMRVDQGADTVVRTAEPRIACSGGNVFVAWKDSRDGDQHVYFNSSSDYGQTWQATDTRIDTLDGAVEGYRYGPIMASDSYGDVYVAWVKNDHLHINVSYDLGQTWAASETQLDQIGVPDPGGSRPSIAVSNHGNAYVAWTSSVGQMYLNRSNDFGVSWLPLEQRISDDFSIIAVAGTVTADANGHVYGLWYYQAPDASVFTVRFNVSSDYGLTWNETDTLLGTTGVSVHPFIPHLASDESGRVYAIWLRYITGGIRHIYGNASFDYGATWEGADSGFQVDSAKETMDINSHEPFVACDQAGTGAANWIDRRDPRQTHMFINTFGVPSE